MPLPPPPMLHPTSTAASAQLEFRGAALSMPLAAWRALPYPGSASVRPVCAGGEGAAQAGLMPDTGKQADAKVCTYAYVGPASLRAPVPIGGGFTARRVRYVFEGGRLATITYQTSPDAFDAVVARIDAQIGHAADVRRDLVQVGSGVTLPRVRMHWRSPAGSVDLIDPAGASGRMQVSYAAPAPTT